jgi:hypothetical protein
MLRLLSMRELTYRDWTHKSARLDRGRSVRWRTFDGGRAELCAKMAKRAHSSGASRRIFKSISLPRLTGDERASRNLAWKFVPVGEKLGRLARFEAVGL